jgi:UDP-glucose 4-epimerase
MLTYLVTGAAGFIGSSLSRKLIGQGHKVVTIDNLSTGTKENLPDGIEFFFGDCADSDIYKILPEYKYDAIFHIAGQSSGEISFDDPIYDIKTNTESTLLLLQFALQRKCSRFIYASTMSVYGAHPYNPVCEDAICQPKSFYGVGKLASEHYLRIYEEYGINTTSLRLFNVYGPGQNLVNQRQGMVSIFLAQLINQRSIHVKGSGDRFRDFIYIDDVVEAFIRCLKHDKSHSEIINVGTGIQTSVDELIRNLLAISKAKVPIKFSGNTSGDIQGIYADVNKFKSSLGINRYTSLNDGLQKMLQWATRLN